MTNEDEVYFMKQAMSLYELGDVTFRILGSTVILAITRNSGFEQFESALKNTEACCHQLAAELRTAGYDPDTAETSHFSAAPREVEMGLKTAREQFEQVKARLALK